MNHAQIERKENELRKSLGALPLLIVNTADVIIILGNKYIL